MTEPDQTGGRRRQQPEQRRDVAVGDSPGQEITPQARAMAYRKQRIAQVATIVKDAARDLERLLPDHLQVSTFLSAAGAALWKSQDLMEGALSDPDAFLIALRESARLGHVPGTEHYWLTPRKANKRSSVLGIEGYEGIIERMYRSGGVLSVHAEIVRANDDFQDFAGPDSRPLHKVAGGSFGRRADRGDIVGVYAYAMLPGKVPSQVIKMTMEDLMEIKAISAAGGKIWDAWPEQMYKKSALRRLEPYVPVSAGYRQTAAQTTTYATALAPQMPVRMEDTAEPAGVPPVETPGVVEGDVTPSGGDRPVVDVEFDPRQWGGDDPAWQDLPVARPGGGVPDGVRDDE